MVFENKACRLVLAVRLCHIVDLLAMRKEKTELCHLQLIRACPSFIVTVYLRPDDKSVFVAGNRYMKRIFVKV